LSRDGNQLTADDNFCYLDCTIHDLAGIVARIDTVGGFEYQLSQAIDAVGKFGQQCVQTIERVCRRNYFRNCSTNSIDHEDPRIGGITQSVGRDKEELIADQLERRHNDIDQVVSAVWISRQFPD
jgi:hypothetical protein